MEVNTVCTLRIRIRCQETHDHGITDLELLYVEVVEPLPLDDAVVGLELPHLQLQLQPQEVHRAQRGQLQQPVDRGQLLMVSQKW